MWWKRVMVRMMCHWRQRHMRACRVPRPVVQWLLHGGYGFCLPVAGFALAVEAAPSASLMRWMFASRHLARCRHSLPLLRYSSRSAAQAGSSLWSRSSLRKSSSVGPTMTFHHSKVSTMKQTNNDTCCKRQEQLLILCACRVSVCEVGTTFD